MKKIICWIVVFLACSSFAQSISVTQFIKDNDIVQFKGQKLILIDFWATWCAPCIPAGKQLQVLQKKHPNEFFMISLTDEGEDLVKKYLQRNYIEAMVANDLDKTSFEENRIFSRPYVMILNLKGKVVWQGHPAEVKSPLIEKLYQNNKKYTAQSLEEVIKVVELKKTVVPTVDMELKSTPSDYESFFSDEHRVTYSGSLKTLIGILFEIPDYQIKIEEKDNFSVSFSTSLKNRAQLLGEFQKHLKEDLGMDILRGKKTVEARKIEIKHPSRLWDKNQINMGSDFTNFMLSDERLQIDNAGVGMIARMLSELKNEKYYYNNEDRSEYDWDFHYKYDAFLKDDLEEGFGLEILGPETVEVEIYQIHKP